MGDVHMASHPPDENPSKQTGIGVTGSPALIQTEQHWNTFAYEWNPDSGVVALSGDCDKVLGVKVGSHLTGRQILPRLHPDDVEKFELALAALTPEKPLTRDTYRVLHPERGVTRIEANG